MDATQAFKILSNALKLGRGPTPSYRLEHVWAFLDTLKDGPRGRKQLSAMLRLGEGSVRSIIRNTSRLNLVRTDRKGCNLTEKGISVLKAIRSRVRGPFRFNLGKLTVSDCDVVFIIRGASDNVGTGLELRDAALLAGAKGATTIIFRDGVLRLPGVSWSLREEYPRSYDLIMSLKPVEGDAIVAGTAFDHWLAELGARRAVLTLLKIVG